jgi:hypothetical protein
MSKQPQGFQQFGRLENSWENRSIGHCISKPSLHGRNRKGDVVPILERKVGCLKNEPDKDRPWNQKEEFFGSVENERIPFTIKDHAVNGQYVGPPGKAVEPTVERFDFLKMESPGNNESNDPKDTMNWKDSSHKMSMYHICS